MHEILQSAVIVLVMKVWQAKTELASYLTVTFHYREDNDSDDLSNDQWYETFSVNAEEKVYDDLCSITSSKVD